MIHPEDKIYRVVNQGNSVHVYAYRILRYYPGTQRIISAVDRFEGTKVARLWQFNPQGYGEDGRRVFEVVVVGNDSLANMAALLFLKKYYMVTGIRLRSVEPIEEFRFGVAE